MPQPSSITRISLLPPDSVSMRIERAPASKAFSSNSFTTDAGRSTTSPAAILLATVSGSMRMRLMDDVPLSADGHNPSLEAFQLMRQSPLGRTSCVLLCRRPCCNLLDGDPQVVKLIVAHRRRRLGHQILGCGCLGEGDHLAYRFFPGQQHHHAVETQRDSAMRRRAVCKGVEEKAEALPSRLLAQPQRLEQARLHVLAMDSYASGAQLDAVQHQVVALGPALPGGGFQLVQVFLEDPGERMLRADPTLVAFAPFKERKTGNPGEFPFRAVNQVELVAQVQANLSRNV